GRGGAGDRVAGAHDHMRFEQLLGQDVTRAACIQAPGLGPYGSCSTGFASPVITSVCSTANLCIAWPEFAASGWACHVATYSSTSQIVGRREYKVTGGAATLIAGQNVTTDKVTLNIAAATFTAPFGYQWVSS